MNGRVEGMVSAPGKVFLFGEYAVLEGAPAVVMATSRRVLLRKCEGGPMRPLVALGRNRAAERLGRPELCSIRWVADSTALYERGKKIGLGSSAAVVTAAVASVFFEAGYDVLSNTVRGDIWRMASKVHDAWQQCRGSGADIAACVFGGTIVYQRIDEERMQVSQWTWPAGVRFWFFWSGQAARTKRYLQAVLAAKSSVRGDYLALIEHMAALSRTFAEHSGSNPARVIELVGCYSEALERLGRLADVPIMTGFAKTVSDAAKKLDGAAKPCGAGGGDIVMAVLPEDVDPVKFGRFGVSVRPLDLNMDQNGVRPETGR